VLVLFLAPLAAGISAGYAFGGRLRQLARIRIRAVWLLWLAAALQLVHFRAASLRVAVESRIGMSLMVPIFGLVFAWVLINLPHRPLPVQVAAMAVLAGGIMNAAVIAANGRMPYAESAVSAAHQPVEQKAKADRSPKHVAMDSTTRLAWLGDVIPVPPAQMVISAGDVVLLLGAAGLIATSMRAPRTPKARPSSPSVPGPASSMTR
jgi:hypothetical protein